ncbi:MAG: molecular chaperone, partial [Desulfopila sp.]
MEQAIHESRHQDLLVEYARLFVGPFELLAPPYGSVYLETGRRLMGDSTIAVQHMYTNAGLTLDVQEAPDHIALELEFMHYLC